MTERPCMHTWAPEQYSALDICRCGHPCADHARPVRDVAPKRMSALQKLRGARDILDIAIDHVERAHVGDAYKKRGVREQATSAIAMASGQIAEAGALFMVEVLREGVVTDEPAQPGCGDPVEDGTPCGTDRGKSIALCETCFDVALDRAGWKGPR